MTTELRSFTMTHRYDWGSGQYEGACCVFEQLTATNIKGDAFIDHLKLWGLNVTHNGVQLIDLVDIGNIVAEQRELHDDDEITELDKPYDATSMLYYLRACSWDGWAAIPYVASLVFADLEHDGIDDTNNSVLMGVCCALLNAYGIVTDIEVFKGFDT